MKRRNSSSKGFTLLELLIAVALLAILAAVVVFILNPAEILKKTRDSQRLSDMNTLRAALSLYVAQINEPKLDNTARSNTYCAGGSGNDRVWVSYPSDSPGAAITGTPELPFIEFAQTSNANLHKVNGTGWIPVDFTAIKGGPPVSNLPVDPTNTIANLGAIATSDLIYRYSCRSSQAGNNSTTFELNARMESDKFKPGGADDKAAKDGGNNSNLYEVGTDLTILAENCGTGGNWASSTVDSAGNVGGYASLAAIDSNTIFISYGDWTNFDLKFAKSTNCGQGWTALTVDSTGDVGRDTSIDAADSNNIFIAHRDLTNGDLKFTKSTDGGSNWSNSTVDTTNTVGENPSLDAVDSSTIFISYYYNTGGDLKFAKSTNGGSSWTLSTIDSTGDVGYYSSLSAVDANTIFVSYYSNTGGNLKFAKSTNGGSSWTLSTIDSIDDVGGSVSMDAVDSNTIYVSYYNYTETDLNVAKSTNGGSSWYIVQYAGTGGQVGNYNSIDAVDSNNTFVSYADVTNADLGLFYTNTGFTGFTPADWITLDSTVDAASVSSIRAINANTIFIAYRDNTNEDLKFIKKQ